MIKAVVFDADGVLIHAEYFSKQYERDFGVPAEKFLPYFNGAHELALIGQADAKEEMSKYLNDIRWKKSVDELFAYWHKVEHKINQQLIDYIKELQNKGIICCLATNQEKYRTAYMLNNMGFEKIFDHIFSSAYIGYKKPQFEFYQVIIDKLGLKKDEVILWDDTEGHLKAAKVFGIHAELYTTFEDFKKKMQTHIRSKVD